MRQRDGSELFGANDPRSADISIIDVEPGDDRQSVLTAVLTQDKLGRKQTVVVLPAQNNAMSRQVDFEGLKNTQRGLQTQIIFVTPRGSRVAEFARQQRFTVFLSLEKYANYAQSFLKKEPASEPPQTAPPVEDAQSPIEVQPTLPLPEPREHDIEQEETQPLPDAHAIVPLPEQTPAPSLFEAVPPPEQTPAPPPAEMESTPVEQQPPAQESGENEEAGPPPAPPAPQEVEGTLVSPAAAVEPEPPAQPPPPPVPAVELEPSTQPPPQRAPEEEAGQPGEEKAITVIPPAQLRISAATPVIHDAVPLPPRRTRRRGLIVAAIVLLVLVLGGLVISALAGVGPLGTLIPTGAASATITITPATQELSNTYVLSAVTRTPDAAQRQVRARFLSSLSPSQSQTIKVTGIGTIPAVPARGTLTFYNALPFAQTVRAGSVFTDANGIKVVSEQVAVIPPATPPMEGAAVVPAHATDPGARGNIPAFDFKTVLCCLAGVTVDNTEAFSGGQDQQAYTYAQQSDIDGAAQALKGTLVQSGLKALQAQILPNERLVSAAQCTPTIVSDHMAGDKTSSITVTETVSCLGEVYDQQGALLLAESLLRTDAARSPGAGYGLAGRVTTTLKKVTVIDNKGTASVLVQASGRWTYQFDAAHKKAFAGLIAGKSQSDAQATLLRQAGVKDASISLSGGFGDTLPADAGQITIVVQ